MPAEVSAISEKVECRQEIEPAGKKRMLSRPFSSRANNTFSWRAINNLTLLILYELVTKPEERRVRERAREKRERELYRYSYHAFAQVDFCTSAAPDVK